MTFKHPEEEKAAEAPRVDSDAAKLAAATLTGDVRDFLLDRVKRLGKP